MKLVVICVSCLEDSSCILLNFITSYFGYICCGYLFWIYFRRLGTCCDERAGLLHGHVVEAIQLSS